MEEISEQQENLIERFIVAYNSIDKKLRQKTGEVEETNFNQVLQRYTDKFKGFSKKDRDDLKQLAKLRNFIVHERTKSYSYLAIPSPSAVEKIERICDQLVTPKTAFSEFKRDRVISVETTDTVQDVLTKIHTNDFSQFPVYESGRFVGLLTENGITRWLANHVAKYDSMIELKDESVKSILDLEEKRSNCQFASRDTAVDEVIFLFKENVSLEAVLITQSGKTNEKLLGIATSWDILMLRDSSY